MKGDSIDGSSHPGIEHLWPVGHVPDPGGNRGSRVTPAPAHRGLNPNRKKQKGRRKPPFFLCALAGCIVASGELVPGASREVVMIGHPRIFSVLLSIAMFCVSAVAGAQNGGIATHRDDDNEEKGMDAKTFFGIVDKSLTDKFNSLILIYGGCFTHDFTKKSKTSTVGTSGKPVAVLAATSEDDVSCAGGTNLGNSFTTGVTQGFQENEENPEPDVESAFDRGKFTARRSPVEGQTPTFTTLGEGAKDIRLGKNADSYHAIIFYGKPTTCGEWNDLEKIYKQLKADGYPAANIRSFFGNGERGTAEGDSTPRLSNEDFSAGKTVKEAYNDGACPAYSDQGQTIEAATFDNLKDALEDWKKIREASDNEQYFFWAADHSTLLALADPSDRLCDENEALCSVDVPVDQQFIDQPADDVPAVVLRPSGALSSTQMVSLNGVKLGFIDTTVPQGEMQTFDFDPALLFAGTNEISVNNDRAEVLLEDIAISTGSVPVFRVDEELIVSMTGVSGAWFDITHTGEGYQIEILSDTRALVYWFTYDIFGNQRWFVGVGVIVGNRIIIDELLVTEGGLFGPGFDPDLVALTVAGEISFSFLSCELGFADYTLIPPLVADKGDSYDPDDDLPSIEPPQEVEAGTFDLERLTVLDGLDCEDNSPKTGITSAFSGSWFDPAHDGEGFTIEVLADGLVVVFWFSYDPLGNQAWFFGVGTIDGKEIHVDVMLITEGGLFGPDFDPDDVMMTPWGEVHFTLDCDDGGLMTYASVFPEYGSGAQALIRATSLAELPCD